MKYTHISTIIKMCSDIQSKLPSLQDSVIKFFENSTHVKVEDRQKSPTMLIILQKIINNFTSKINDPLIYLSMPISIDGHTESTIFTHLASIRKSLNSSLSITIVNAIEPDIIYLAQFQKMNGIYDSENNSISIENNEQLSVDLELNKQEYFKLNLEFSQLQKKMSEMSNEILTQNNQLDLKIVKKETQYERMLELEQQATRLYELYDKELNKFNLKSTKIDEQIATLTRTNENIKPIEEKIQNLLGASVASNLNNTFQDRAKRLSQSATKWTYASIIATAVALAWSAFITSDMFNNLIKAPDALMTHLRTIALISPIYVLVFYCFTQRNKERLLEEEYSFKASVALTLDTYQALVTDLANKDQFIKDSVSGVYRSPLKHGSLSKTEANVLIEGLRTISEKTQGVIKKTKP